MFIVHTQYSLPIKTNSPIPSIHRHYLYSLDSNNNSILNNRIKFDQTNTSYSMHASTIPVPIYLYFGKRDSISNLEERINSIAKDIKFSKLDGHILQTSTLKALENISRLLNQYKKIGLTIELHTDNIPNLSHNLKLSKKRAFAINQYLTDFKKIDQKRIKVIGLGGKTPKYSFETQKENKKNNRTEITIHSFKKTSKIKGQIKIRDSISSLKLE